VGKLRKASGRLALTYALSRAIVSGNFPSCGLMSGTSPQHLTEFLVRWRAGDQEALEQFIPLIYKELRDIARYHLNRERPGHPCKVQLWFMRPIYVFLIKSLSKRKTAPIFWL
jgi:ECF sigma factor